MPELRPEEILRVLEQHQVAYVVIGALGAVLQGSPIPTQDVDITPQATAENLARLSKALTQLQARVRTHAVEGGLPFSHSAESLAAAAMRNLTTPYGDLDISFTPAGTQGYDDLQRDAVEVTVHGVRVPLASLADIIRSKEAAGRDKDRRALPVLREILARQPRGGGSGARSVGAGGGR